MGYAGLCPRGDSRPRRRAGNRRQPRPMGAVARCRCGSLRGIRHRHSVGPGVPSATKEQAGSERSEPCAPRRCRPGLRSRDAVRDRIALFGFEVPASSCTILELLARSTPREPLHGRRLADSPASLRGSADKADQAAEDSDANNHPWLPGHAAPPGPTTQQKQGRRSHGSSG